MTTKQIKTWLNYWMNAKAVAVNEIRSLADVTEARRFCAVMRKGVFTDVTDQQIWEAIGCGK